MAVLPDSPQNAAASASTVTKTTKSCSNVRVVARIRPLASYEIENGSKAVVSCLPATEDSPVVVQVSDTSDNATKRWFELDAVLDTESTQDDLYVQSGTQRAVRQDLFQGYNSTILCYGQTGAGKTHSMGTNLATAAANDDNAVVIKELGVLPRACHDLFAGIREKCDGNATVELMYMEIYNEEIRDLMRSSSSTSGENSSNKALRIRETLNGEVYVSGLTSKQVKSPQEIGYFLLQASKRRVTASTQMNAVSSRSHAICVLTVRGVLEDSSKFQAKLTLVDLAGSERIKKTGAEGDRRQEGICINKGLFVLGQVVSALAEQRPKYKRNPPYRDSKLTRLLQDSLGGNSRTIMIACVSPADFNVDETINTLRYASSARNIKNTATRNVLQSISPQEAAKLLRENQLLKTEIKDLQHTVQRLSLETTSVVSGSSSTDGLSDDEGLDDEGEALEIVDADKAAAAQHIAELEKQVKTLKTSLKKAQVDVRKSTAASSIVLPAMKTQMAVLKEELEEADQVKRENEELWDELAHVRADASSARLAATQLSRMMEDFHREVRSHNQEQRTTGGWNVYIVALLCCQLALTFMIMGDMFRQSAARTSFENAVQPVLSALSNYYDDDSSSCRWWA